MALFCPSAWLRAISAAPKTSHAGFDCSSQWRTSVLKLKFSVVIIAIDSLFRQKESNNNKKNRNMTHQVNK